MSEKEDEKLNNQEAAETSAITTSTSSLVGSTSEVKNSVEPQLDTDQVVENTEDDGVYIPDGGKKAWINLGGAFLGFTGAMGIINSNGAVQQYISLNILENDTQSTIGWVFGVFNFLCFGFIIFSGPLFSSYGAQRCLTIGIILFAAGYMSLSECKEVYQFVLSNIVTGLGLSFVFATSVGIVGHYFRRKRGLCLGLGFSGGAIGGIIFPIIMRSLFPKIGFGWTIRVLGFVMIALFVGEFIIVRDRCKETQLPGQESLTFYQKTIGKIRLDAFKERVFPSVVFGMMFNNFSFMITLAYIVSYGVAVGYTYHKATTLTMIMNGTSIVGRSLGGHMADKYGRFNIICVINMLSTFCFLILWLPHPISHTYGGLVVFSALYGIALGSNISLGPSAVGQISTTANFTSRYGTASFFLSFMNLFGISIGGAIIGNHNNLKGLDNLVIFISCLSVLGCACNIFSRYRLAGFKWKIV